MARQTANDLYRHSLLVFAEASNDVMLKKYANAVFAIAEEDGYTPSRYDSMKNEFLRKIDAPRPAILTDVVGPNQPVFQMAKQYVDHNPEEGKPSGDNKVLYPKWNAAIPDRLSAPTCQFKVLCPGIIGGLAKDKALREERPEVSERVCKLESASNEILSKIDAIDFTGFPKTVFNESRVFETVAEDLQKQDNKSILHQINEKAVKTLTESQMDAFNRTTLYFPFVENVSDKIQLLMESEECNFHNETAVGAALMVYESMKDGVISYFDAEALIRMVNEATFNEFSIGQMAPVCGVQNTVASKLRQIPIEKVIDTTNEDIDARAKEIVEIQEDTMSFLEYVIGLCESGVVDPGILEAYKEAFYESILGGNYDYEDWDTDKIKEKFRKRKKDLDIYKKFEADMRSAADEICKSVMKDFDAYNKSSIKDQVKTRIKNAAGKITGKKAANLDSKKLQNEANERCIEKWTDLRKTYQKQYGIEIKGGAPKIIVSPNGEYSISLWVSDEEKCKKDLKNMKEELERRKNRTPKNDPKESPKNEEPKESESPEKKGKVIDISKYKKRSEKPGAMKKSLSHGNTALKKESVNAIGFALVEYGAELGSPMMEIYEACFDLIPDYAGLAYLEATKVPNKRFGIFEVKARKVFDKFYQKLSLPKKKSKEAQFEGSLSADRGHMTIYYDGDEIKKDAPRIVAQLRAMGFDVKETNTDIVATTAEQGYIITCKIDKHSGSMVMNYEKVTVAKEAANIDSDIEPIIATLNRKGYKTLYSCSGHPQSRVKEDQNKDGVYNAKMYTTARITFAKKYDFSSYPDRWRVSEKDGKISIYAKPYTWNENQGDPDDAWEKWKSSYMATLASWAESLPKEGEDQPNEAPATESVFESLMDQFIQIL